MNILLIAVIVLVLLRSLSRSPEKGMGLAVFLLTGLSAYLSIQTPGDLPKFTVHRIILICLFIFWLKRRSPGDTPVSGYDLFPQLVLLAAVNFISMLFSIDRMFSFKTYLAMTLELFLFYILLTAFLWRADSGRDLLKKAYAALFIMAVFGIIEKKSGFNPVDAFLSGYVRKDTLINDVMATFPHRIFFGLGMAVAWPLGIGLSATESTAWKRKVYFLSLPFVLLACYFSDSRGPWAAAFIASLILLMLGSAVVRKRILIFGGISLLAMALNSGARETLQSKVRETRNKDSFKGQTYQYRWELWGVALTAIAPSLKTLFIGTGPGTSEVKSYITLLSYSGEEEVIESWDNEYAATLLESGFLGLSALLLLHLTAAVRIYHVWKGAPPHNRDLLAALLSGLGALLFMMTNVKMFSPQINYLTWTLLAVGLSLGSNRVRNRVQRT